jgi:anaerobic selenocysteine-containing dehydrogenase
MHPDTAGKYGISDGDLMVVETRRGSIEIKARVSQDIMPNVVSIPHGWPESCENVLTDDTPADPVSGYIAFTGLLARVTKKV